MSADRKILIESEALPEALISRRNGDDVEARIGFIGPPGDRLFASFSLPTSAIAGAVLICSSLHVDFTKNYRNEVLLGWALARAGFAVLRFHYRGSGHSDGSSDEIRFSSMCVDAAFALDRLRSDTGAERVALVGCRLGAIVAAATVVPHVGAPLVLWEPIMAGSDYVREALRAQRLSGVATGSSDARPSERSIEQVREAGFLEVHGYALQKEFMDSLARRSLAGELGKSSRPIMMLHASRQEKLPRKHQLVLQRWTELGFPLEVTTVPSDLPWWFTGARFGRDHTDLLAREGIDPTVAWIRQCLSNRAR